MALEKPPRPPPGPARAPGPLDIIYARVLLFPQHLVEGLLNFRRRVCRSFWLDLGFQNSPQKTDQCCSYWFSRPPQGILPRKEDFLNRMP